ncbi:integrase catalytic region, partial [Brucella intermedia M86]
DTKPRRSMLDPSPATGSNAAQYESLAFPPVATNTPIGVVKTAEALIAVG